MVNEGFDYFGYLQQMAQHAEHGTVCGKGITVRLRQQVLRENDLVKHEWVQVEIIYQKKVQPAETYVVSKEGLEFTGSSLTARRTGIEVPPDEELQTKEQEKRFREDAGRRVVSFIIDLLS